MNKVRMRATMTWTYLADPEDYETSDPEQMAQSDLASLPSSWAHKGVACQDFKREIKPEAPPKVVVPPGVDILFYASHRALAGRKHKGAVVIAVRASSTIGRAGQNNMLTFGFSFCSPTDKWNESEGQRIALERFTYTPLHIPFIGDPKSVVREIIASILAHEFDRLEPFAPDIKRWAKGRVPRWTQRIVKRYLKSDGNTAWRLY